MELERRTTSWFYKYKKISVKISQNFWDYDDYKYDGWFTLYLILNIDKFDKKIQHTLNVEYHEKNGNILNNLKWTYGGLTFYKMYSETSSFLNNNTLIKIGCDYAHYQHHQDFKKYDFTCVKNDATKLVDSLIQMQKITTK